MNKKEIRRKQIIDDSIELMHLNGYNGTSVNDIANAAKIPKGSFYNYFEGKEQYAIDALNYYGEMRKSYIGILNDKTLKPLDRIKEFYRESIVALEEKGLKYGCFVGNLTEEMGDVSEAISKAAAEFHEKIVTLIYDNLVEAKSQNKLNRKTDLRVLANFIVSSWQGSMLRMKAMTNTRVLNDFYTILVEDLLK